MVGLLLVVLETYLMTALQFVQLFCTFSLYVTITLFVRYTSTRTLLS